MPGRHAMPTTRGYPTGWTGRGLQVHLGKTLRVLAFLQGVELGRDQLETARGELDACRRRDEQRQALARRMQDLTARLLADTDTATATTAPIPTQRRREQVAS